MSYQNQFKTEHAELLALRKAVHDRCMLCSGGSLKEADRCKVTDCPLLPYRPRMPKKFTAIQDQQISFEEILTEQTTAAS